MNNNIYVDVGLAQSYMRYLCVQLCSLGACACVWAGVGLRLGRAPLAARLRLLLLGALSSLLLHAALLLLHVTRLAALLPLDWNKLVTTRPPRRALAAPSLTALCVQGAWTSAWSFVSLAAGGALTLHAVLAAPEYRWAPRALAALLLAAAGLGLGGALLALGMALGGARGWLRRRAAARRAWGGRSGSPGAAYRAVPAAPAAAAAPVASTSRDDPL